MECNKQFQRKKRKRNLSKQIWNEYVHEHATTKVLSKRYNKSNKWIRQQLDLYKLSKPKLIPREVVLIGDATFIQKYSWILIFRDPLKKENIYSNEIFSESTSDYQFAKGYIEERGFVVKAFVGDGRAINCFLYSDIPLQMCHFHQEQIIVRCVTNNPKLEAGKEILGLIKTLPYSEEKDFTDRFNHWNTRWNEFLKEKTRNPETGRYHYTHKKLRQARGSLKKYLPYLFTYKKYPELNIPNTTNSLDGFFKKIKTAISIHAGLTHRRKLKMVKSIIMGRG